MAGATINLGRVKGSIWYTGPSNNSDTITSEIIDAGYKPVELDLYLNINSGDVYQYKNSQWQLQGNIRGAQGPQGEGFTIKKSYSSIADMEAGFDTDDVPLYGFVIIDTGDVEDADNAKLYIKNESGYHYLTDLSGAQGIKGDPGTPGEKGDDGATGATALQCSLKLSSASEPRSTFSLANTRFNRTPKVGDFVMIGCENTDNGKSYIATYEITNVGSENTSGTIKSQIETTGIPGQNGTTFTPAVDSSGNLSWTNDGGKENPATINIKGADGQGVPAGGTAGQVLTKKTDSDYDTEWGDAPSGDSGGGNLLPQSYTITRTAGVTYGDQINLGYSLGLELNKKYIVKYKLNGTEYTANTTFEAAQEGAVGENINILTDDIVKDMMPPGEEYEPMPIMLGGAAAFDPYFTFLYIADGYKIVGNDTWEADAGNASLYLRAIQNSQAGTAVTVELLSIEEVTLSTAAFSDANLSDSVLTFKNQAGDARKTIDLTSLRVPTGGTAGQVLKKKTDNDYDIEWGEAPSGGGGTSKQHLFYYEGVDAVQSENAVVLRSETIRFTLTLPYNSSIQQSQLISYLADKGVGGSYWIPVTGEKKTITMVDGAITDENVEAIQGITIEQINGTPQIKLQPMDSQMYTVLDDFGSVVL